MIAQTTIYLDNAATTFPKPEAVYVAHDTFARTGGANANRGNNPMARRAAHLVEETRAKLLHWIAADGNQPVIFAPSATIALNQAILGTVLQPGQTVLVSPFEHNSVLRPLEHLRVSQGIVVREIPWQRASLEVDWSGLDALLRREPPTLLVISQASNVCGLLLPVEEIAARGRAVNPDLIVIVDGSQAAGLYPLNLSAGLIDYLVFSGHKSLYGPFGAAGLVLCSTRRPRPVLFGGTGTHSQDLAMPTEAPARYEPGSLNSPALAGLNAALDWLESTGPKTIVAQTARLMDQLEEGLSRLPGVRPIRVAPNKRAGVMSFNVPGISPQALEEFLGNNGIAVRAGLHCAPWAHRFLDTQRQGGTVRVSPGFFNTAADIEQLLQKMESLLD